MCIAHCRSCEGQHAESSFLFLLQDAFVSLQLLLAESGPDADAEALQLLTTLVDRGLVTVSGSFRPIAELMMLRQPEPHVQTLALLAALASQGAAKCATLICLVLLRVASPSSSCRCSQISALVQMWRLYTTLTCGSGC